MDSFGFVLSYQYWNVEPCFHVDFWFYSYNFLFSHGVQSTQDFSHDSAVVSEKVKRVLRDLV